ncbi:FtsK/SpoIIIE domain-containing protein [Actinomadura sp. WMMA1423]|uniref:FtsK/SpoIIIE domain-containing protein n=1 Tax=Actinomadura sp. WMMA1423 TaxID=2591108 RepID=UPI00197AA8F9|nr:FtsK/SpoIIIE domain-containing protein [Actinomadura sp. WMMA1423]
MTRTPRLYVVPESVSLGKDDAEEEALEGEIVDLDEEDGKGPAGVLDVVYSVVDSPAARLLAEHGGYVVTGVVVVAGRAWERRTGGRYERMLRAAEAMGDHAAALDWEEKAAEWRRDRHQRRMDLIEIPGRVITAAPKAGLVTVGGLGAVGVLLAVARQDVTQVVTPFVAVAEVTEFTVVVVTLLWLPVALVAPLVVLLALWGIGLRHENRDEARWVGTAGDVDMDVQIDETTIARALEALRIPQITAYLKDGLPLQYITTARRDGRGTHAVLRLPAGVTADRIARRRADLASGLYRLAKEVWPSTGGEAGVLDLWVADKGALEEGAGPYPLLDEGLVDVFKGVPFGRTLRGDPTVAPLIGRNTIVGGIPGQGKSSAARVIMAGAALDPTAELRIWVPDSNYDFESFRPRCARYVMGAEDERIEEILVDLRELHAEVQDRGQLLVQCQEPEVTRTVADKVPGLHPLVCLLEEAHVALNHREHGDEISWLVVEIVKLGRKRGIHFIVSTQAPTSTSMPRDVTRNCSNGIAFAVGDHVANDALLGQGAYRGGHRATDLIPGTDKGTALVKGFSGERSEMVQAYFLSVAKDHDQVTPLVDRALTELRRRNRQVPGTDRARPAIEERDLLADLDEVLGAERVRLADVPALLRDLAPHWAPYRTLNGTALRERLEDEGVPTTNAGNVRRLDPGQLRKAIADRSTADLDEQ